MSCSNYTGGYFTAYRGLSTRDDLDAVIRSTADGLVFLAHVASSAAGQPSVRPAHTCAAAVSEPARRCRSARARRQAATHARTSHRQPPEGTAAVPSSQLTTMGSTLQAHAGAEGDVPGDLCEAL